MYRNYDQLHDYISQTLRTPKKRVFSSFHLKDTTRNHVTPHIINYLSPYPIPHPKPDPEPKPLGSRFIGLSNSFDLIQRLFYALRRFDNVTSSEYDRNRLHESFQVIDNMLHMSTDFLLIAFVEMDSEWGYEYSTVHDTLPVGEVKIKIITKKPNTRHYFDNIYDKLFFSTSSQFTHNTRSDHFRLYDLCQDKDNLLFMVTEMNLEMNKNFILSNISDKKNMIFMHDPNNKYYYGSLN